MKKILNLIFLLAPFQIAAQQFTTDLQKQLDTYYQSYLPLKVHVFTNQPEFAAGDTVYYKVNLVSAQGHRPIGGKSILSVALLNSNNETVLQNGISITDGIGSNQIILPPTLLNGDYFIAVWSDWMTEGKSLRYKKLIRVGVPPNTSSPKRLFASPEGGNLIVGLNNRVVLTGRPLASGQVNENGIEIARFTIAPDGTSSFYVTPKEAARYEIVVGADHFSLPEVKEDGIGILVTSIASKNSKRVYLTAPDRSAHRNKLFHLVLSMQGIIYQSLDIQFKNQSFFTLDIPLDRLPQGIAQLTLLDDQRNVLTERLIYNDIPQLIKTQIALDKKQFKTREKIDLKLITTNGNIPTRSKVTLTSFNTTLIPIDTVRSSTLPLDLYLFGDAGFDTFPFSNTDNAATIDNKLVLAKWSRFDWKNLSKRNDNAFYSQYMRFSGKAFDIETKEPVADSTKITFFLHKNVNTYHTYTNATGEFSLSMLFEFYDTDEVYYRVERKGKLLPNVRVSIDETPVITQEVVPQEKNKSAYLSLFDKRKRINESYAYHTNANRSFVQQSTPSLIEDEIFGPDVTIRMEDYHLFPNMIETLREVIPFSQHRKIRGKDVVRIFNSETKDYWPADPVYVIDGVMTDDTDYFLSINPADIAAIKLVHDAEKLRTFGTIGSGGLFIVETKIPDNHKNVHRSVRTFTMKGMSQSLARGAVSHPIGETLRIPDLRTNILWIPQVSTNDNGEANISFYASDVPGKYKIEGEGVSSDGKFFIFEEEFEVVFDR